MFVCVHKSYKEEYIPSVKLSGLYDFCFLFLMYFWNFFSHSVFMTSKVKTNIEMISI